MSKSSKSLKRKIKDEVVAEDRAPKKAKLIKIRPPSSDLEPSWTPVELLAEQQNLDLDTSEIVINLFEEGNTIPFLARYRRDITNNLSAEKLREIKETHDEICTLRTKITKTLKSLEKTTHLTPCLQNSIASSRTLEELEYVYAPYKPGNKRTLAERAKELGLEKPALQILNDPKSKINLSSHVDNKRKELLNVQDVEKGIMHILATVISTDTELLQFLRELRKTVNCVIKTKKTSMKKVEKLKKPMDDSKFDNYDDFEMSLKYIKPHQVMAINRGENLKILSVKIVVPDKISHDFTDFCHKKWLKHNDNAIRSKLIKLAINDAYSRLVQPLITREIRSEMKVKAERASCDVFSTNLKHLLLAPPLKGKTILGIDPGFSNGCKLAAVSPMGQLLGHDVIHPIGKKRNQTTRDEKIITGLLSEHKCDLVALGNGTGCRETEEWLADLIKSKNLNIQYTIVSEDGASIYSCSAEAKKEFPNLDPNIISALSLARRIQDPLSELVKVEPKHLGIGMYQHDLKKKQLNDVLNEVISECVSFVGVDLNTTSQCLLKHVAGLSDKRATQIIQFRNENGPFNCRKKLLEVSGIGSKIFQQCAGFLRVTSHSTQKAATKLDATYIHPESYDVTAKLLKKFKLKSNDIGERDFIDTVKIKLSANLSQLSHDLDSSVETVRFILETLSKPLGHDYRSESTQILLFKKGVTKIDDLSIGSILTGKVTNVTHFGCFVDIGVGKCGLIHVSKCNGLDLQIGDRVEVKVLSIQVEKGRISLQPVKKL